MWVERSTQKMVHALQSGKACAWISPPPLNSSVPLRNLVEPLNLNLAINKVGTVSTCRLVARIKFRQTCKLPDIGDTQLMLFIITDGTILLLLLSSFSRHWQENSQLLGEKQRVGKGSLLWGKKSAFNSSLSTSFCSGLFYLTAKGLFRMWSFHGFQSIFSLPLLWFLCGLSRC